MCHEAVVDVDVDKGEVLEADDDDNDQFSRAGSDALIETEKLLAELRADLGIKSTTHAQSVVNLRISEGHYIAMQSCTEKEKHLHASYHPNWARYHGRY